LPNHLQNKYGIHQNKLCSFSRNGRNACANSKNSLYSSVANNSASEKTNFLFCFQTALGKSKETFCEGESVTKPNLKILANLLHGEKYVVNKVEQGWTINLGRGAL